MRFYDGTHRRVFSPMLALIFSSFGASGAQAQLQLTSDISSQTSYIWRGLTRARGGTVQPAFTLGYGWDQSMLSVGSWLSFEINRANDKDPTDAGRGGGRLGEVDYWIQFDHTFGSWAPLGLAFGVQRYHYHGDTETGGLGPEAATTELYVQSTLGLSQGFPFRTNLLVAGDIEEVKGVYTELGLEADLLLAPLGIARLNFESIIVESDFGFSFGQQQGRERGAGYYEDNGPTHIDLGVGIVIELPLGPLALSAYLASHVQFGADDQTRRREIGTDDIDKTVWWGEFTLSALVFGEGG